MEFDLKRFYSDVAMTDIKEALRQHTETVEYQTQLSLDHERFDLHGNVAGSVTSRQRRTAKRFLKFRLSVEG